MKILVVSEVFWPEEFIINDLVNEWIEMGHRVEVLTQYPSYPQGYVFQGYNNRGYSLQDWNGVKIHRFHFIEGYRDSKQKKFLNYLWFVLNGEMVVSNLEKNYDCIFVSQTGPLTVALPAIKLSKKNKIPMFIWTFDLWPDVPYAYGLPKSWFSEVILTWIIKRVYNSCDKIFVSSRNFGSTIRKYTSNSVIYAPNWLRKFHDEKSDIHLDEKKFHFTFTGNISLYQNLLNTVKGFARANISNAVLNIIGDGSCADKIRDVIESLNVENVVIMYGRKPFNQMNDLLVQSDVLVLPLISDEGIGKTEPLKLLSYLRAGRPILGIADGSVREIIEENAIGICVNPDDVDDIAEGFRQVTKFAKEHSEEVRINANKLLMERFNKERIVKLITETLQSVDGKSNEN